MPTKQQAHPKSGAAASPASQPSSPVADETAPIPFGEATSHAAPFPIDALVPVAADAVRGTIDIVQAPGAMCAQTALGALAYAAQAHIDVQLPLEGSSPRPVSLFLGTLGKSGERKSEVDARLAGALYRHQEALCVQHKRDMAAYRSASKAGEDAPYPLEALIFSEEPTFEGLCDLFIKGQPSMCILSDEGGQFAAGHAMSDDAQVRTAAGLSNLWTGKAVTRVRAGEGGSTLIAGRRLSVHLMIQPEIGMEFFTNKALKAQGLLGRFLVCAPRSTQGGRTSKAPSPASQPAIAAFTAHLSALLSLSAPVVPGERNVLQPRALPFAANVASAFDAFADENESELGDWGRYTEISSLTNKAAELAARIAAIQQWVEDPDAGEVSAEAFERGVVLMRYYLVEALRLNECAPESDRLNDAKTLLKWLKSNWQEDRVAMAHILQRGPNQLRRKEAASPAIAELEERRWLIRLPKDSLVEGKKFRDAWAIAPQSLKG